MRSLWTRLKASVTPPPGVGSEMAMVGGGRVRLADGRMVRVRPFLLDVRPVTNADYERFLRMASVRRPRWMLRRGFDEPEQPVVGITFDEAVEYARWVGKRLPTEAEWIRAARGDDGRPYPWGTASPDPSRAHFGLGEAGTPAGVTDPGARFGGAAPFGHRDLAGNVWEWCETVSLRGGFWGSDDVPIDARLEGRPDLTSGGIGFRCAC